MQIDKNVIGNRSGVGKREKKRKEKPRQKKKNEKKPRKSWKAKIENEDTKELNLTKQKRKKK